MAGEPIKLPTHEFGSPVPGDNNIASLYPFGLGYKKPRPLLQWLSALWQHRHDLGYAWRILIRGVCDGCSIGPIGLRDKMDAGFHVCPGRAENLQRHAQTAILKGDIENIAFLRSLSESELQMLGRISHPLVYRAGKRGFSRVSWDAALDLITESIQEMPGERMGWVASPSNESNEAHYTFNKAARLMASNNIDICSSFSYRAGIAGLQKGTGMDTGTCSISDLVGTDLILVWGSDLRSHQPAIAQYIIEAKDKGSRVVVFDTLLPQNMEQAWEISSPLSTLFGSRLVDDFIQVNTGGESACVQGILKQILAMKGQHQAYIDAHTTGFSTFRSDIDQQSWRDLERLSGVSRREMEWVAELYIRANSCVSLYSTGFALRTARSSGVQSIVNLHLSRGMLGRPHCGILAVDPYNNLMGAQDCGVSPSYFPSGRPVTPASAAEMSALWGAKVPSWQGMSTASMLQAAHQGKMDFIYSLGGNLLKASTHSNKVISALGQVSVRVHQGTSLNPSMLIEPGELTIILPTQSRYEQHGGGTYTSTDRRIRYSPEISDHPRVGESRPAWQVPCQIATRTRPELAHAFGYGGSQDIRNEMGRTMPRYAGIETLGSKPKQMQWGQAQRGTNGFPNMKDERASFTVVDLPVSSHQDGEWLLSPRWTESSALVPPQIWMGRDVEPGRDELFISADDIEKLGLQDGSHVRVYNETGEWHARLTSVAIKPGMLQAHWPECQALMPCSLETPSSHAANTVVVRIESR